MKTRAEQVASVFDSRPKAKGSGTAVRPLPPSPAPLDSRADGFIVTATCSECGNPPGTFHWPDCPWWDLHPDAVPF